MNKNTPADNHTQPDSRRRNLILGGLSLLTVSACAQNHVTKALSCPIIPEETAGPYPADGSNPMAQGRPDGPPPGGNPPPGEMPMQLNAGGETPNFLARSDKIRSDLTRSSTGAIAGGIPVRINLQLVNTGGCTPLAGYAVYIWHCTADGRYSMYSDGLLKEDFLRGVQSADQAGNVQFTSIFPGCYAGRWPHIHFEIYPSAEQATDSANKLKTSQLALPEAACRQVYAHSAYGSSLANLGHISLDSDNVFGDGYQLQMAEVSGDEKQGYNIDLKIGLSTI